MKSEERANLLSRWTLKWTFNLSPNLGVVTKHLHGKKGNLTVKPVLNGHPREMDKRSIR